MSHIHVLQQFSSRLLPCNRCSSTQEAGAAAAQLLSTVGMTTYPMKRCLLFDTMSICCTPHLLVDHQLLLLCHT
jgi:hypothetical protein